VDVCVTVPLDVLPSGRDSLMKGEEEEREEEEEEEYAEFLKMPEHVEIRGATETGRSDIGSRDSVQQLQYELQQQELVESRPLRWHRKDLMFIVRLRKKEQCMLLVDQRSIKAEDSCGQAVEILNISTAEHMSVCLQEEACVAPHVRPAVVTLMALLVQTLATGPNRHMPVGRAGLLHLIHQQNTILQGTLKLGPAAVGMTKEAMQDILRLVTIGMEAGATWHMCARRAMQRARQIRNNYLVTIRDLREVEVALQAWGEWDAFHPPIAGHALSEPS